jgi:HD-GYP domain-containing protein (c-di-GMP phosphodiesterase class II)
MGTDIGRLLKRETQLNTIAYSLILALLATVGLLVFTLMTGAQMPDFWLLRDQIFRTLATGFLLMVILYLADQHRRLRAELVLAHTELDTARLNIAASYDRLAFAHHAAEVMTSLAQDDGLRVVLAESVQHFGADAAAVVGDDITITTAEGIDESEAQSAVLDAAMETVRAGKPMSIGLGEGGSIAIAVPLRVRGQLKSVAALWRRDRAFNDDELEGLGLLARIIELGMENRLLLAEVKAQLSGTLRAMVDLVEHRRPNYIPHSTRVAECAVSIGTALGMAADETADLRLAAMLQDIGMLQVPDAILSAPRALSDAEIAQVRMHAENGADLARIANFDKLVQDAILYHHERLDGSGYPAGLKGDSIPLVARILAVCDSYVAMTSDRPHRQKLSPIAALNELRACAGTAYDPRVVREFVRANAMVMSTDEGEMVTTSGPLEPHPRVELMARRA